MAYPEGWVGTRYENPDPAGASEGTLLYVVAYANPKGAQANGSFLDSEQIAVYRVDERTAAGGLDREAASRLILDVILKDMATMSPRTSVQRVSVHGRPAWQLGYEYKVNGEVVSARSALMVKGTHAYWLTCQSETYSWRTVALTLDTVVKRFTLD